jgi:hypothetical protein
MFIGYIYGIPSERQLQREIEMNLAYRWFLGLKFKDHVPHHSTISWNRQYRFNGTDILQELFDEIVLHAMNHKMVGGRVLFSDTTHLKANANKHKYSKQEIEVETREYFDELNKDVEVTIGNYHTVQQTVRAIKNINLIRRGVKPVRFFPNVHAPKIR